jgi:hypothetical protein
LFENIINIFMYINIILLFISFISSIQIKIMNFKRKK